MSTRFYFGLAFAVTWVPLLPASLAALGVLPGSPQQYMAGAAIAVFGPTIAAIFAARREGGGPAVRELFRGFRAQPPSPLWYLLALLLPTLLFLAGRAVYGLIPGNEGGAWFYFPSAPERIAGMFIVPVGEEIGWRGFAMPRLIARHGALRATLYLAVLWGIWHLPMFLGQGMTPPQVIEGVLYVAIGNVFFSWFYRRSGASLLLAVLLHVGLHANGVMAMLPGDATPTHINFGIYVVLGLALLAFDRRAFAGHTPAVT